MGRRERGKQTLEINMKNNNMSFPYPNNTVLIWTAENQSTALTVLVLIKMFCQKQTTFDNAENCFALNLMWNEWNSDHYEVFLVKLLPPEYLHERWDKSQVANEKN